jgi:putative FmdB family regulatory protein
MPVYEYECGRCGAKTELLRPMRDADQPVKCEGCGASKMRRVQSVFAPGAASSGALAGAPGPCAHCRESGSCARYGL